MTDSSVQISQNFFVKEFEIYPSCSADYISIFNSIEINAENFFITSSNLGVALFYKHKDMHNSSDFRFPGFDTIRKTLYVFNHAGNLQSQFILSHPQNIVCVQSINFSGQILVLYKDGEFKLYTQTGILIHRNCLIHDPNHQQYITAFSIRKNGICAVFNDNSISYIDDLFQIFVNGKLKVKSFKPQILLQNQINHIQFIPNQCSQFGSHIIVNFNSNEISKVSVLYCRDQNKNVSYTLASLNSNISQSNSQFFKSILHNNDMLFLMASLEIIVLIDFTQIQVQVFTHEVSQIDPFPFEFLDILPIYSNQISSQVLAIIPSQNSQEIQISNKQALFLQSFQNSVLMISGISPNIILTEDIKILQNQDINSLLMAYQQHSCTKLDKATVDRSEQLILGISDLKIALLQLINLSSQSFELNQSVQCLKTSSFCKLFLEPQEQLDVTRQFDQSKKILRTKISIGNIQGFLTEFKMDDIDSLCFQLISSGYGELALKIAQLFNLQNDIIKKMLIYKAYLKALDTSNAGKTDKDLFKEIEKDLEGYDSNGVFRNCAELLTKESQRSGLVGFLIEKEPSLIDQVRLYHELRQYDKAIRKAYQYFNEDMVIDSLLKALKDVMLDQKQLFIQLFTPESLNDDFPLYMKNLIQYQIHNNMFYINCLPQLALFGNNFLDQSQILDQIAEDINDQDQQFENKLYKQLATKFISDKEYLLGLDMLASLCTTDSKNILDTMQQCLQILSKNKLINKFISIKADNISQIMQKIGQEISLQCSQKNSCDVANLQLYSEIKTLYHKLGKYNIDDEFLNNHLAVGLLSKCSPQDTKVFDSLIQKLSSKQQKLILSNILLNQAYIDFQLAEYTQYIEKRDLLMYCLMKQNSKLVQKSLENLSSFEMILVHWSWKSLTQDVQNSAKEAIK
ncbi:hypothetical protein SS50377_23185 [Spironucleus salmonicida]|uniref:Uncharacterized protein n=1 Tax=Spironucleus salmonicida TaxID=348837 RepID=V6LRG3_9EUKA|nr:hypothetical protein SS50377_23185 [Spironucleus salmonicida]|eukprot:EST46286.1 hypothetical protein SS50377_13672 [Spironucleus salmonicida]